MNDRIDKRGSATARAQSDHWRTARGAAGDSALAPTPGWGEVGAREHFVQFYESDAFLLISVGAFIGAGLLDGETPNRVWYRRLRAAANRFGPGHTDRTPGKTGDVMTGTSKTTTDHEAIRTWIEQRGGTPARVEATGSDEDPGLLRVDFPGYGGKESLERISWEDFFEKFEEKELAFLYQDEMRSGEPSRFFEFISRESAR